MNLSFFAKTDTGLRREQNQDAFAICGDLNTSEWATGPFLDDAETGSSVKQGTKESDTPENEARMVTELAPASEPEPASGPAPASGPEPASASGPEPAKGSVMIVADGLGGPPAGEIASKLAVSSLKEHFNMLPQIPPDEIQMESFLKNVIIKAHNSILEYQEFHPETDGMGTTAIVACVVDGIIHLAWAGDSRCYIHTGKDDILNPFTSDHSVVWEMVEAGKLTPEEAKEHPYGNIVTQSLGQNIASPNPSTAQAVLKAGMRVLLCSDGLNNMLDDHEIQEILDQDTSTQTTCEKLVASAKQAGGDDNITCVVMDVQK